MQLNLLKGIGTIGIITDWKKVIHDHISVEIGEEGELTIGRHTYRTDNGRAVVPEWAIPPGNSKILFVGANGDTYNCGVISRNGRFINVTNGIDELSVALALAYEAQSERIGRLEGRLEELEKGSTIKIV